MVHTKASGDHRASTRCVSRILACALRRDTMAAAAAAAALHVSPLFCTPWTKALMANVSLSCRLAGFSAYLSLYSFFFSFSLSLLLCFFLEECSSRRAPAVISRKIPFSRLRPEKFYRARRLPTNGGVRGGRWVAAQEGESKSAQRGWKRNCFVSESTVCSALIGPLLAFTAFPAAR